MLPKHLWGKKWRKDQIIFPTNCQTDIYDHSKQVQWTFLELWVDCDEHSVQTFSCFYIFTQAQCLSQSVCIPVRKIHIIYWSSRSICAQSFFFEGGGLLGGYKCHKVDPFDLFLGTLELLNYLLNMVPCHSWFLGIHQRFLEFFKFSRSLLEYLRERSSII